MFSSFTFHIFCSSYKSSICLWAFRCPSFSEYLSSCFGNVSLFFDLGFILVIVYTCMGAVKDSIFVS